MLCLQKSQNWDIPALINSYLVYCSEVAQTIMTALQLKSLVELPYKMVRAFLLDKRMLVHMVFLAVGVNRRSSLYNLLKLFKGLTAQFN